MGSERGDVGSYEFRVSLERDERILLLCRKRVIYQASEGGEEFEVKESSEVLLFNEDTLARKVFDEIKDGGINEVD